MEQRHFKLAVFLENRECMATMGPIEVTSPSVDIDLIFLNYSYVTLLLTKLFNLSLVC